MICLTWHRCKSNITLLLEDYAFLSETSELQQHLDL